MQQSASILSGWRTCASILHTKDWDDVTSLNQLHCMSCLFAPFRWSKDMRCIQLGAASRHGPLDLFCTHRLPGESLIYRKEEF